MKFILSALLFIGYLTTISAQSCNRIPEYYIQEVSPTASTATTTAEHYYNLTIRSTQNAMMALDVKDAKQYLQAAMDAIMKIPTKDLPGSNGKIIGYIRRGANARSLDEVQHYAQKARKIATATKNQIAANPSALN